MKKIVLLAVILFSFSIVPSFAVDLNEVANIRLSNSVIGTYFSNATGTEYSLSTGHLQGNRAYASSSNDQIIYYLEKDGNVKVVSDDLLQAHNGNFESDSGTFDEEL